MKIIKEEISGGEIYQGFFGGTIDLLNSEGETTAKIKTTTYEEEFPLLFTFEEEVTLEPRKDKKGKDKPEREKIYSSAKVKFPFEYGITKGELTLNVMYKIGEDIPKAIMKEIGNKLAMLEFAPRKNPND